MRLLRLVSLAVAIGAIATACGSSSSTSNSPSLSLDPAPTSVALAESAPDRSISPGPMVLVELIELQPGVEESAVTSYLDEIDSHLSRAGGQLLGAPIEVLNPVLQNPALPVDVVEMNADFVVMMQFDTAESHGRFEAQTAAVRSKWQESVEFDLRALAIGGFGLPLPGTKPPRPAPAFYLLNMFGPQSPDQQADFLDYVSQASPRAASEGTVFFDGLVFAHVLGADTPFATIGLTEWTSLDVFHEFHADPGFLELVEQRNSAVTSFVEAAGVARADSLP